MREMVACRWRINEGQSIQLPMPFNNQYQKLDPESYSCVLMYLLYTTRDERSSELHV